MPVAVELADELLRRAAAASAPLQEVDDLLFTLEAVPEVLGERSLGFLDRWAMAGMDRLEWQLLKPPE